MSVGLTSRIAAACVAAIAWIGLGVQWVVLYRENASMLVTLGIVSAFFTITTNLLVALVFTSIAVDRTWLRSDWMIAGTMLSILLVGIIYTLLLHGTMELSGGSVVANILNHMVTPIVVPLYWIFFAPKGGLQWKHPLWWAAYPMAYFAYALVRGAATHVYPYPFMDLAELGWGRTLVNAVVIALGFMVSGYAVVWVDHLFSSRLNS